MKPVAFVTAGEIDVADLETGLLMEAFRERGGECVLQPWDAAIDWSRFSPVVIRSCWDYHLRIGEFREWAERTSRVTQLFNPWPVLYWNSHKSYLLDLQRGGVPIMPTQLISQGNSIDPWPISVSGRLVAKPAVGIGASGIDRGTSDDASFRRHVAKLLQEGDVLIQPYHFGIEEQGEVSLIFLADSNAERINERMPLQFSHAVRKIPARGDYRVQQQHGGVNVDHPPTQAERAVAERALSCVTQQLLYARVDLVHWQGEPVVMELELIEPQLFLGHSPRAVNHFADCLRSLQRVLPSPVKPDNRVRCSQVAGPESDGV